jgi:type IV secretion system protein VirD4
MSKLFELNPAPSTNKHDKDLKRAGAYDDVIKIQKIKKRLVSYFILAVTASLIFWYPLHVMLFGGMGIIGNASYVANEFFGRLFLAITSGNSDFLLSWANSHYGFYFRAVMVGLTGDQSWAPVGAIIPIWKAVVLFAPLAILCYLPTALFDPLTKDLNPTPNIHGDSRWADARDIEKMSKDDLAGFDGKHTVLGKVDGKLLRMKETLSTLVLAPPGTGKTAAIVTPTILSEDETSLFIYDPKPELHQMTSGHRSTLGPTYALQWSALDMPDGGWVPASKLDLLNPDLIEHTEAGVPHIENGMLKLKPHCYPSWNPLGPGSAPGIGDKLNIYIERLAATLAPNPKGGGDDFWVKKARAFLNGAMQYIVVKMLLAKSEDPAFEEITWKGIPANQHGNEPSIPAIIDWLADISATDGEGDDPIRGAFQDLLADIQILQEIYKEARGAEILGRAKVEFASMMASPDKTRGSVLTTADEALSPFKNEAVRQRTGSSSFSFSDMRGRPSLNAQARENVKVDAAKAEGKSYAPTYADDDYEPVTVYVIVGADDRAAFASITAIFIDSLSNYLIQNGPREYDDRGRSLGPLDYHMIVDEAPTLPKLQALIGGPAEGRSKRISYSIFGQDLGQFQEKYSQPDVETLLSTTAHKIVLTQNNLQTSESIAKWAGKMTYRRANYTVKGSEDAVGKFFKVKKEIISGDSYEGRSFLEAAKIMSLPKGEQLVFVQNFMNRPVKAKSPAWFLEPEFKDKGLNLRTGSGPKPALPMPSYQIDEAFKHISRSKAANANRAAVERILKSPASVLMVSAQNLSDFSFNPRDMQPTHEVGDSWTSFQFDNSPIDRITPTPDSVHQLRSADELKEAVIERNIVVFSDKDKADLIRSAGEAGLVLDADLVSLAVDAEFVRKNAPDLEARDGPAFWAIGEERHLGLHLPEDPAQADHEHAMAYFAELAGYILDEKMPHAAFIV